jgi:hypothetical protein
MLLEPILRLAEDFCNFGSEILPVRLRRVSFDCNDFLLVLMLRRLVITAQEAIERHSFVVWACVVSAEVHYFLASTAGAVFLFLKTLIESLDVRVTHR